MGFNFKNIFFLLLYILVSFFGPQQVKALSVEIIAGEIGSGYADGPRAFNKLNNPTSITWDDDGNMLIADSENNRIRKLDQNYNLTTYAGMGAAAYKAGAKDFAYMDAPRSIINLNSEIYFVDRDNHCIRKIDVNGDVLLVAGTPESSGDSLGASTSAQFNTPTYIIDGGSGNLIVTDTLNHKIKKINLSTNTVSLLAGSSQGYADGAAASAQFDNPKGLARDSSGNIFVADDNNNRIRMISPGGTVSTFAGSGSAGSTDGTGTGASFNSPEDIAIDSNNNLYVADFDSHKIRKITPGAVVSTLVGHTGHWSKRSGDATEAFVGKPRGLAFGPNGNLYVSSDYDAIFKIDLNATFEKPEVYSLNVLPASNTVNVNLRRARFKDAKDFVVDSSGNIFISDQANHRIKKIDAITKQVTIFAGAGAGYKDDTGTSAKFRNPHGLAIDGSDNIYVADQKNHRIRKITPAGVVTTIAGSGSGYSEGAVASAKFKNPSDIVIDSAGNLYVADNGNRRIRMIDSTFTTVSTIAGSGGSGHRDGLGTNAEIERPFMMAIDSNDDIYVTDTLDDMIRKLHDTGSGWLVTTLLQYDLRNTNYNSKAYGEPYGITVDANDNLYFTSSNRHAIFEINKDTGKHRRIAGNGFGHSLDGSLANSSFRRPEAILAVGTDLYVFDKDSDRVRLVDISGVNSKHNIKPPKKIIMDNYSFWSVKNYTGGKYARRVDGDLETAAFDKPNSLYTAGDGSVYVGEEDNRVIRKIYDEQVSTFSGSGADVSLVGSKYVTSFKNIDDIVVDSQGNVYASDYESHVITKMSPDGSSTYFAGQNGSAGFANGIGTAAQFNEPRGLAIDEQDNIYVADSENGRIRKIAPDGTVTTLAGTGKGSHQDGDKDKVKLNDPVGLVYHDGSLYFTELASHTVRKLNLYTNEVTTLAGTGASGYIDGKASQARFRTPTDLAVDSEGNILVVDRYNYSIRIIRTDGQVRTLAGSGIFNDVVGSGRKAKFESPRGITEFQTNKFLIADSSNNKIKMLVRTARPNGNNIKEYNSSPNLRIITNVTKAQDEKGVINILADTYFNLLAASFDKEDGPIDSLISWRSDIQGLVGTGQSFNIKKLNPGIHRMTVKVSDSKGASAFVNLTINVQENSTEPEFDANGDLISSGGAAADINLQGNISLEIIDPTTDPKMYRRFRRDGILFAYAWQAITTTCSDAGQDSLDLKSINSQAADSNDNVIFNKISSQLKWHSDNAGVIGQGETINLKRLTPGIHEIKASIGNKSNLMKIRVAKNKSGRKRFRIIKEQAAEDSAQ